MKWFDWRKLCRETQQTLRIQAVLLVTEADEAPKDVIHFLGLTPSRLFDWLAKYRKGRLKALMSRPRPGRGSKLTRRQANWVRRVVSVSTIIDVLFFTLFDGRGSEEDFIDWNRRPCQLWT